jgi:hypothetical protein
MHCGIVDVSWGGSFFIIFELKTPSTPPLSRNLLLGLQVIPNGQIAFRTILELSFCGEINFAAKPDNK